MMGLLVLIACVSLTLADCPPGSPCIRVKFGPKPPPPPPPPPPKPPKPRRPKLRQGNFFHGLPPAAYFLASAFLTASSLALMSLATGRGTMPASPVLIPR